MLEIYRRHVAALAKHQSEDGSWREVVDEPASYRELTVTAMTTAALARGITHGWIDRKTYEPIINRGWQAVAARVNADGTFGVDGPRGKGIPPGKYQISINLTPAGTDPASLARSEVMNRELAPLEGKEVEVAAGTTQQFTLDVATGAVSR